MINIAEYRGTEYRLPIGESNRPDLERDLIEALEKLSIEVEIPGYMLPAFVRHVVEGGHMGHFLTAVFENDLMEAFARADPTNRAHMNSYLKAIYNAAPRGCHGSVEKVIAWRKLGGMAGNPVFDRVNRPPDDGWNQTRRPGAS